MKYILLLPFTLAIYGCTATPSNYECKNATTSQIAYRLDADHSQEFIKPLPSENQLYYSVYSAVPITIALIQDQHLLYKITGTKFEGMLIAPRKSKASNIRMELTAKKKASGVISFQQTPPSTH